MSKKHRVSRQVEFRDTDAAGIMHFSTFVTYMEEAEHDLLRTVGLSVLNCEIEGVHLSWPRVAVKCDFARPLRFEETFVVEVGVEKLGGKSVRYGFEFLRNEQSLAKGTITAVCCTMENGRMQGIEIPESIVSRLSPYLIT